MIFSEVLSILLNVSNTSIQEFASAILYDRSYISKWVNDRALPSASNWDETKANILSFFEAKLSAYDVEHLAIQYPYIQAILQSNQEQSKKELIDTLLTKAYARTSDRDELRKQKKEKNFAITFTGVQDVIHFLVNYLTQNVYGSSGCSTFYYMGNIVRCFNDELLDNIYINYMSPNSLRVKFTVDMDSLLNDKRKSLTFINAYFRLISALPFLNLEIYEAARSTANIVRMVQKGNIAAWGFELKNDVPDILFVVENEENVDESYQSLRAFFDEKNPIVSLQENVEDVFSDIRNGLSSNVPIFYTPRLYLYYGSAELREQMFEDRFINRNEYDLWYKLQTIFSSPAIRQAKILITRAAFNDTFARGWIYKTNGSIQIFGDHYKKYMEDLFMMFQRQNVIILDDEKISHVRRLPTVSIYGDPTNAFILQFNQMTPYETLNIMYQSKNQAFTTLVSDWLQAVMNIEHENFLQ